MLDLRTAYGFLSVGRLVGDPSTPIGGVSTDTRTLAPGDLFVALRGERFDAHAFAVGAREAGAAATLVETQVEGLPAPFLQVPDARRALGELAAGWRRRFRLPVIAVTGSNGKTTVKEMIAAILAAAHGEAGRLATRGNLNNDVGVPQSVLALRDSHLAAVFELGMNRPGEIAWLAHVAAPTVALVNNAQREHQEFLESVEATARENGAAIAALPPDGVAVFPGDDPCAPLWQALAGARRRLTFGLGPGHDVRASAAAAPGGFELVLPDATLQVALAIDGLHNVRNALAAAACAHAAGIAPAAIAAGLAAFRPYRGRLARLKAASGARLIDDTYNANPDSVRAAIDVLAAFPEPRWLVLGDMGEVGERGAAFHAEIGAYARERGLRRLFAHGEAMRAAVAAFGEGAEHFASIDALSWRLRALAGPDATVLVKGSRFMRMERVVAALAAPTAPAVPVTAA